MLNAAPVFWSERIKGCDNSGLEFQSKSPTFCVSHVKRAPHERHFPFGNVVM